MAKTNRVVTVKGEGMKSILAYTGVPFWSVGVILNDQGVTADENGKKSLKQEHLSAEQKMLYRMNKRSFLLFRKLMQLTFRVSLCMTLT